MGRRLAISVEAGAKLGPYEILSPLGAGGMGEVYRARDTRLEREVAVKVLPESLAKSPEALARFEREAKLLASLNHPNIAAIHGFDDFDGHRFLVMEYVEGETLAGHLKNGPVAVEDALDIAKQIAEALEAAHGQGVIHRDLKPANVIIRPDGAVKVLDFGLAKAMAGDSSGLEQGDSPTITANYTRPGVVLGTAAYMSPEQARGRPLDKRTDIWSLGILLFECLTGNRLFQGETANDSMGAIMHKDPEWSLLPPNTPPTIQLLLRRCLTKDRKRRLHDIADARIELENALVDPTSTSLGLAAAALDLPRTRLSWRWLLVLVVAIAAIGVVTGWLLKPSPASRVARLTLSIPPEYDLAGWPYPTLSPDGQEAVFLANSAINDESTLIVRALDQAEFRSLKGTSGATRPFFCPEGDWIAFEQEGKLKKLSMRGGSSIILCDAPSMRGGTWRSDGSIVFAPSSTGGLMRIPASGGTPEPYTTILDANEQASHRLPYALPDNRGVVFTFAKDYAFWGETSVMVVSEAGGVPKLLVQGGSTGQFVAPGFMVFLREETLMAARFDLNRLELSSQAVPVVEGVTTPGPSMSPQFSVDAHGTLMYMTGSSETEIQLVLIDHSGKEQILGGKTGEFGEPRFSHDDRHVAFEYQQGSETRIGILERERDILRMLPSDAFESDPIWSPDGKWLAFGSRRYGGTTNLYRIRADLSGEPERLTTSKHPQVPDDWSPDGRTLVFLELTATGGDIGLLRFDENGGPSGAPEVFVGGAGWHFGASFSPDGQWISYASVVSGFPEVFVQRSDGSGSPQQVSTAHGMRAQWSHTENILFYVVENRDSLTMQAVKYEVNDGVFSPHAPETVFSLAGRDRYDPSFDLTSDGEHFLFARIVESAISPVRREPTVVLNWTKELETLVPAD